MKIKKVESAKDRKIFIDIPRLIYKDNNCRRDTEESITKLLINGPTLFHTHAAVIPCLLFDDHSNVAGRCAFIHDRNLPDTIQVAFFEAIPGLEKVVPALKETARALFKEPRNLVVGLNGHLNYGAGFLLNHFDRAPVFGLPYTQSYYPEYFSELSCRTTVSFRFPLKQFYSWQDKMNRDGFDTQGISVRFMNKKKLKKEIELYTHIDNTSFSSTKYWYWSNRNPGENFELFNPFKPLIDNENLIFAEKNGKPAGFLLWYPDFNELAPSGRDLGLVDVIRYRLKNPIKTVRFTEVALLPEFRRSPAVLAMILKMIGPLRQKGYEYCEGGFIFEENMNSIVMTRRFLERSFGIPLEPFRKYGIYEGSLS
jgi:hypothetical protein